MWAGAELEAVSPPIFAGFKIQTSSACLRKDRISRLGQAQALSITNQVSRNSWRIGDGAYDRSQRAVQYHDAALGGEITLRDACMSTLSVVRSVADCAKKVAVQQQSLTAEYE